MTPSYATPRRPVTLEVHVRNSSNAAISGLSVQLLAGSAFSSYADVAAYEQGASSPTNQLYPVGTAVQLHPLAAGHSVPLAIPVPAKNPLLCGFGVYPLQVQVYGPAGYLTAAPALLPYVPGKATVCGQKAPKPADISWVWPVIDQPHQGACPASPEGAQDLLDNSLAASIAPHGRLDNLLTAVTAKRSAAGPWLTLAIDPGLLDSVHAMTTPYLVGAHPARHGTNCSGARTLPASRYAADWLSRFKVGC